MRIIKRHVFDYDYGTLEFIPVKDYPGFSHRVVINNQRIGWLGKEFKPNIKNARYFIEKHIKKTGGQSCPQY